MCRYQAPFHLPRYPWRLSLPLVLLVTKPKQATGRLLRKEAGHKITTHLEKLGLSVFFGPGSIDTGSPWPQKLFEALADCHQMVALLSPAYLQSKPCQDEFNIAWNRRYKEDREVIYPIYWQSAALPPHMELLQYNDSRDRNQALLTNVCSELAETIRA